MRKALAPAAYVVFVFASLFGFWLLLVGTNSVLEQLAGAVAAAIGSVAAITVRRSGLLDARPDPRMLARTAKLPLLIVVEFWWIAAALVRGRRPHGGYVATPFDAGGDDPEGRGRRAIAGLADSISPNILFLDAESDRDRALRHGLDLDHVGEEIP
jgi:hypothetical protein